MRHVLTLLSFIHCCGGLDEDCLCITVVAGPLVLTLFPPPAPLPPHHWSHQAPRYVSIHTRQQSVQLFTQRPVVLLGKQQNFGCEYVSGHVTHTPLSPPQGVR